MGKVDSLLLCFVLMLSSLSSINGEFNVSTTQSDSSTTQSFTTSDEPVETGLTGEQCFYGFSTEDTSQLVHVCVNVSKIKDFTWKESVASITDTYANSIDLDYLWVLFCGILVFFMQSGFTLLEAGMVKHTNVQNILFKNVMDACIGAIAFFLFGYCIAYGNDNDSNVFLGINNIVIESEDWNKYFFQWAFAATAATIVSGSVAERTTLHAYFIYTITLTVWTYPIVVHWIWSHKGWLSPFNNNNWYGIIDFAGSSVVHMVGGWSGLMGAIMLGPRKYRFDKENASKHLKHQFKFGHNVPFQVLGTFILWFGWYGFNAGSTLSANGSMELASKVAVNTTLAAGTSGIIVAVIMRFIEGIWMIPAVCNGTLSGLVSITASCAIVDPWMAIVIGGFGGIFYVLTSSLLEYFEIDDPLEAWPVHGCSGFWGVIAVGFFGYKKENIEFAGYNQNIIDMDYGTRLGVQIFAGFIIMVWTVVMSGTLFFILKIIGILRVEESDEETGLDVIEHGGKAVSYARAYSIKPGTMNKNATKK